jgi:UDP-2,4-diacetamido-2,4,6-trideoxy-beta-L-altropyranose hydrolase
MKVIFRADGNSTTGLGHIMRSVALMQMLESDFKCEFWTRNPDYLAISDFAETPVVRSLDKDVDYQQEAELLAGLISSNEIIILDGYQFDTNYQKKIKKSGAKLLCIDDIMAYHFVADAIINHAGGISDSSYQIEDYTKLYLGPQYALVKKVFCENVGRSLAYKKNRLLIVLGAADPENKTEQVLELVPDEYDEIHVVIGAANKNTGALKKKFSHKDRIIFHVDLTGNQMCKLMMDCSTAILTPSTVCYEYMTIGGGVWLYQIADNQQHIKEYFLKEKLAFDFNDFPNRNYDINEMIHNQRKIFDGKSGERVKKIINSLSFVCH